MINDFTCVIHGLTLSLGEKEQMVYGKVPTDTYGTYIIMPTVEEEDIEGITNELLFGDERHTEITA